MRFLKKVDEKLRRYGEVKALLEDPAVSSDPARVRELGKEYSLLGKIHDLYREYQRVEAEIEHAQAMADDRSHAADMIELARHELAQLEPRRTKVLHELETLFLQDDPVLAKNVIMEIRAGTGGLEAGLFAGDLLRMYTRYAQKNGFKIELLSSSPNEAGGLKEVIASVTGQGAFGKFKFESGTHRVQRVPATETSGRIHTSAATVAILPEADEVDVVIKPEDLKIDVFRSGGPGGQSVNTTDSAVRITHLPSGLVVSCQDEKSQLKNKQKGLKILRARLFEKITAERNAEIAKSRKEQVGSGDRSEKIRTYNFPDRRVTDHRVGVTLYDLESVLESGEIDPFIDALYEAELEKG